MPDRCLLCLLLLIAVSAIRPLSSAIRITSMAKAKRDRLLVALSAKLPMEAAQWPRADRIAWLQMIAMALDVVYGPCGGIRVVAEGTHGDEAGHSANAPRPVPAGHHVTAQAPPPAPQRVYGDRHRF